MPAAYLDSNATTPVDPRVAEVVVRYLTEEFGNAGSRTHGWGAEAARVVERGRELIAAAVAAKPDEVILTSGATEANNLAILGLAEYGISEGRTHVITTAIEHKAVLEPIEYLVKHRGFDVSVLPVDGRGWPVADSLAEALRPETLLVSTMHVNNETGVELPISDYTSLLEGHDAFLHVDAAQGFGKVTKPLRNPRIDLMSISAHKMYGPKGVGALVVRRRGYSRPPLQPLMFGGGQERGLRPGTHAVELVAGFGEAVRLAELEGAQRLAANREYRETVLTGLAPLAPLINGDPARIVPHVLNVSLPGIDAEAAMLATREIVAISNGSACTSSSYEPSHVLVAMGLDEDRIAAALRISWNYMTPTVDWARFVDRLANFKQ